MDDTPATPGNDLKALRRDRRMALDAALRRYICPACGLAWPSVISTRGSFRYVKCRCGVPGKVYAPA